MHNIVNTFGWAFDKIVVEFIYISFCYCDKCIIS